MRMLAWVLAAWLALSPALADSSFVAPTATGTAATGQIPGTATNDSASAGNVGQILTNSATTVSVSNLTPKTIVNQALTAGDWDVWCSFVFNSASGTIGTVFIGELSATDNASNAVLGNYNRYSFTAPATSTVGLSTPVVPLSLAGTTTYYCVANVAFSVSTMTVDSKLVARRRR